VTEKQLISEIRKSLLSIFGEVVVADSKLFLNEYDEESGEGILQCSAAVLESVIAAAALVRTVEKTEVSFEPRRTSGTIKSLSG
jgi:RNase P/RNase MRP subunit POP5